MNSSLLRSLPLWPVKAGLAVLLAFSGLGADPAAFRLDPAKVLGTENCAECHAAIVESWKTTHHFDTFNTMHRRPEAREIASKLGLRRIKDESLCVKCHYTYQGTGDRPKAISGIACESCHGAGADWNKVHSNKEDPERLTKAAALGMLRPSNTYAVAANCLSCHTVPEEKLVNETGHPAGSDFELVAWSQGELRHNFQKSEGKSNAETTPARRRVLYVVGRGLDLEYSLRGLAKATQEGKYSQAMTERVRKALQAVGAAAAASGMAELKDMAAAVPAAALKPGNGPELTALADKVGALNQRLSQAHDGSQLAALDPLLPAPSAYKGKPYQP